VNTATKRQHVCSRRWRRSEAGFTALEVSVAIAGGLIVVALLTRQALAQLHQAQLGNAIATARVCAQTAERYRKSASSSSVNASDVYSYTYNGYPSWTAVSTFNANTGFTLPPTTIWGSSYTLIGDTQGAQCRFTAPYDLGGNPMDGSETALGGGVYQYTVYAPRTESDVTSMRLRALKSQFYGENTR